MNFKNIGKTISLTVGRGGLLLKKYSPELLMGIGVVGIIGSTVMACKATLKADDVLDEAQAKINRIHQAKTQIEKMEDTEPHVNYTEQDYKKDLAITYVQTGWEFVKLYGPAVTLGLASIACMVTSHGIMRKRNLALVAAYKTIEQSFTNYRKRVVAEYGEEKDREFKYGIKKSTVKVTEMHEDGSVTEKDEIVEVMDTDGVSEYARVFDESSEQWSNMPGYNMTYIICQQNFFNDMLETKGHVFLNEVYDVLGLPRTQAGAVVGWVKGKGDDYVDFGITDVKDDMSVRPILLDFNVAGIIYNLI